MHFFSLLNILTRKGKDPDSWTNRSGSGRPKSYGSGTPDPEHCFIVTEEKIRIRIPNPVVRIRIHIKTSRNRNTAYNSLRILVKYTVLFEPMSRTSIPPFYDKSRRLNMKFPNSTQKNSCLFSFGSKSNLWTFFLYKIRRKKNIWCFVNEHEELPGGTRCCDFS